jgi:tRNA-dihydrouridine synthase
MEEFIMYNTMTTEEIRNRIRELSDILNSDCTSDDWADAYIEYHDLNAVMDERYREENQEQFDSFYREHIEGKSWDEIDPEDWGFYSDWHKDMYGFRPKFI